MSFPEREVDPSRSARHFYGAEIRRRRAELGWSLVKLAEGVHFSVSTLSRVENGDVRVPQGLSEMLDQVFRTDGLFARLLPLALREDHPAKYQEFLTLADQALVHESYSPNMPGLLQTEAFARHALRAGLPYAPEEEVEERVRARMGRQLRLRDSECRYWFILDEYAFHRTYGGPAVTAGQLRAILDAATLPNVVVQVLPFASGGHSETSSMTLLTLPGGDRLAYEESSRTGTIYETAADIAERQWLYDLLRAQALPPQESEFTISSMLEGLASDAP
ncbi:helix-turn-helix protein [Kitasatospora sp. SolWspMP-SS2h]|uniref:helix-turn-helix domain-containing protein n=1 Tax=Kitasatospora sp. SolWspMP-SS2h TaxID=1305729 RepID=UPI000DB9E0AA|nr:helix-turn-helix transcriptional regulator [Kitasatospora sp. SolWspMP-SS2h]RAJ30979.1 helix-turn-helix protein [Kitasatospora sp. SolWspMP-SS2h]